MIKQNNLGNPLLAGLFIIILSGCHPTQNNSTPPLIPDEHVHARQLFQNALLYLQPQHGLVDEASGYPLEGWNQEPSRSLYLRSFTQITAIGEWLEALSNIVSGDLETQDLAPEQALKILSQAAQSLLQDQQDPHLSDKGLLVNFMDIGEEGRKGPLTSQVDKNMFIKEFGKEEAQAIWKALQEKGWIVTQERELDVGVLRGKNYGASFFNGPLEPWSDGDSIHRIMSLLDHRDVQLVFGDNANLSASVAKTIGALLSPKIKDDPRVTALRNKLELFLDNQAEGYAFLIDHEAGLGYFGWNASKQRPMGWVSHGDTWNNGHSDYMVNEFRSPVMFTTLRFGLPLGTYAHLGFKIKPYTTMDHRTLYVLAPWSGSAFQPLGLSLFMSEMEDPYWSKQLETMVDVELDYSRKHNLPGFLSESFTGRGAKYSGAVGIAEIAVSTAPRITECPSLYTLGIAYHISPDKVEAFLADHWERISLLLSDHGPWEGYNVATDSPIKIQTSAHTLSLILGFLGNASEHMARYLDSKNLHLDGMYEPGASSTDFLASSFDIYTASTPKEALQLSRQDPGLLLTAPSFETGKLTFSTPLASGVNLSGTLLKLHYQSPHPIGHLSLELVPVNQPPPGSGTISKELLTFLDQTDEEGRIVQIPLPTTPGLSHIKAVVLTLSGQETPGHLNLNLLNLSAIPPDILEKQAQE